MIDKEENPEAKIRFSQNNLYQEEIFTDLRIASIHQFTPLKSNGEMDKSRKILFVGHTQVMTQQGPFPIQFPIEAKNLQQAMDKLPEALEEAWAKMTEEAKQLQREEESRIIVPGAPEESRIIQLK